MLCKARRPDIKDRQLADALMELLAEKKASRIMLLDLQGVSLISDYFIICTGESDRQLDAIAHAVTDKGGDFRATSLQVEGTADTGWILIDLGDVILHLFSPEQRDYYQLEQLWSHARVLTVMP